MGGRRTGKESGTGTWFKALQSATHTETFLVHAARVSSGRVYVDIIGPYNGKVYTDVLVLSDTQAPRLSVIGMAETVKEFARVAGKGIVQAITVTRPGIGEPYCVGLIAPPDRGNVSGSATAPGTVALPSQGRIAACVNHFMFGVAGIDTGQSASHNGSFESGIDATEFAGVVHRQDGKVKLSARNFSNPSSVRVMLEAESTEGHIDFIRRVTGSIENNFYTPNIAANDCNPFESVPYGNRLMEFLGKTNFSLDKALSVIACIAKGPAGGGSWEDLVYERATNYLEQLEANNPAAPAFAPTDVEIFLGSMERRLKPTDIFGTGVPVLSAMGSSAAAVLMETATAPEYFDGSTGVYINVFDGEPIWSNMSLYDTVGLGEDGSIEVDPGGEFYMELNTDINPAATDTMSTLRAQCLTYFSGDTEAFRHNGGYLTSGTDLRVPFINVSVENTTLTTDPPGAINSNKWTAEVEPTSTEITVKQIAQLLVDPNKGKA